MIDIDDILNEREKTHGKFSDVSRKTQELKGVFALGDTSELQDEALEMIASKLARIFCGNPNYADHWRDIAGYAMLVVRELEKHKEIEDQNESTAQKHNDGEFIRCLLFAINEVKGQR